MLRVHYIPSWNGDWRLEPDAKDPEKRTTLVVSRPTASERKQLTQMQQAFADRGWLDDADKEFPKSGVLWTKHITIKAPLSEVGPVVIPIAKPGVNVLTAIRFKDGHVEVVEASEMRSEPTPESKPYRKSDPPSGEPTENVKELAAKPDAEAAATVRRATPCCPDCYVDAIKPATDVLLTFLDEEQHRTWAADRYIIVRGEYTRHRYLIAHRHSPIAAQNRRNTYDLDDGMVMHFHDWTVPPEEEVLSAMLILQHREPWLRNEATCLSGQRTVFKNPFGNMMDGVRDAVLTRQIGDAMLRALGVSPHRRGPRIPIPGAPFAYVDTPVTPPLFGYDDISGSIS
jgi:hypothetical protein